MAARRRTRLLGLGTGILVGISLVLLIVRLTMLQGWFGAVRIVGGSMAPGFYGPGFDIQCEDCGFHFCLGHEYPPADEQAVCPNCGYTKNEAGRSSRRQGQRVLVDRWPLVFREPCLWEPVAFVLDDGQNQLTVKRVVAAGNGRVSIRDGDVFLNGKIVRKDLEHLRRMSVPVHNDRYRTSLDSSLPARWRNAQCSGRWEQTADGYRRHRRDGEESSELDWLQYDQWVCWPNASPPCPRVSTVPILDHYGYNHELSRGPLNRVTDLMLSCRFDVSGAGWVAVRIDNDVDKFEYCWCPEEKLWSLKHNDESVLEGNDRDRSSTFYFEMAVCDQQVFVAIDGETRIQYPFLPGVIKNEKEPVSPQQMAIGANRLGVQLVGLRIDRDVHYVGPGSVREWTARSPLGKGDYFLLGDNVPISLDSRYGRVVTRSELIGVVTPLAD